MRHLALLLAIVPALGFGQVQAWEKLVAPGLTYRMEVDMSLPRVIHAVRYSPSALTFTSRPELAQPTVFVESDENRGRAPLTSTIQRTGAVAAINADFFPWNGDPLGVMVRSGELISKPFVSRSVFAWGPGYMSTEKLGFDAKATLANKEVLTIHGINEECGDNMLVLNSPIAGLAVSRQPGVFAILDVESAILKPDGTVTGKVRIFEPDKTSRPVAEKELVLVATGTMIPKLMKAARDSTISISIKMPGIDWAKATHAVGGGPALVRGGIPVTNFATEGFKPDFTDRRHPRTAIGATKEGDIWLVVVDGRQAMSRGATLGEMGKIMAGLGCKIAINLDGGGSSTLSLYGITVNRPSEGVERAISNSVQLFAVDGVIPPASAGAQGAIVGLPRLTVGKPESYTVMLENGETVPDGEIIWSATGNAWVDQSGLVRGLKAGPAKVTAFVRGILISAMIQVEDAKPAQTSPPASKPTKS